MTALLDAVGAVVAAALGWVGDVAGTIAGTTTVGEATVLANPLLVLFVVGVPLVGLGVGLVKRLLRAN